MATIHLFIDSSTFITFYAYTSDDLDELKKVAGLIKAGKLKLYIPEQVADEFHRNREGKLAESLTVFSGGGVSKAIPRFMVEYPEAKDFSNAAKAFQQARENLANKAREDAAAHLLPADDVFTKITEAAGLIATSETILQQANRRRLRGNPPGKKDSIGDQINWEVLLGHVPDGEDLHIVAKDGDYVSALASESPHQFLQREWNQKKNSSIHLHKQLKPFLNENFSKIKFAIDIEKQIAIDSLIYSGSFSTTHSAISELKSCVNDLKWPEVEQIFEAGISNSQISWIGTDQDVNEFYRSLMAKFFEITTLEMDIELEKVFPKPTDENLGLDDDGPF